VSEEHIDHAVIKTLREVMEGGFDDLLDTFLSDSKERIDQLHSTRQACDLRMVAHSLKGSSSNMGAKRLAQLCGQLEERAQKEPLVDINELVIKIDDEYLTVRQLYRAERQSVTAASYVSGG